ncbi:MAG: D-alanine--D-alanine ligase [Lentisphaerae bacterium]|nr:D-alanine--D-alanine ligase [Lentisphaerota bacterium]
MHIGLVYDLRSDYLADGFASEDVAEFDSASTIDALEAAIRDNGHDVERIGRGRALAARLAAGSRWDLVFTIAEGCGGRCREAQVPALLELYGLPYTFSDPLVCAATLDKAVAKRLVLARGLPTPGFRVVRNTADLDNAAADPHLEYPLFVKPLAEGTGKGIDGHSRVASRRALHRTGRALLQRLGQPILVEDYLPGREFTTGLLGSGSAARVLGTLEIRVLPHAATADYTFDVKERCETCVAYTPPEPGPLRTAVETLALECYRALECRDAGRADIRLDRHGRPAFMELNPLPGLHPEHSDLPMIAAQEGMTYNALIGHIIAEAAARIS